MFRIIVVLVVLAAFGCAQDNAMTANRDRVLFTGTPAVSGAIKNKKVFLMEAALPDPAAYQVLGEIKVIRIDDVGYAAIYQELANKALDVGADAVVEIATWREPTTRTFGSPQGMGKAIKVKKGVKIDFSKMKGQWLGRGFAAKSRTRSGGGDELK